MRTCALRETVDTLEASCPSGVLVALEYDHFFEIVLASGHWTRGLRDSGIEASFVSPVVLDFFQAKHDRLYEDTRRDGYQRTKIVNWEKVPKGF